MATTIRIKQTAVATIRVKAVQSYTVRIKERGPQGIAGPAGELGPDNMLKSAYDTDDDGKVNAAVNADIAPWSGVSGKPDTYPPSGHSHPYEPADGTILKDADIGVTVAAQTHAHDDRYYTEAEAAALLLGKSNTDHLHTGVYEPADATLLKSAQIGTVVAAQVHSHDDLYYTEGETDLLLADKSNTDHLHADVYEPADATILKDGDIGVSVADQNHAHAGMYEPIDATILRDADIGVSVPTINHTHGDEWAEIDHNHNGVHALEEHEHTIADIDTEATPADRVLASQGNGNAYWKELAETDISEYPTIGDVVALVIALS